MWLSSISNRTPKAYFLYIIFGAILLLASLSGSFLDMEWQPFSLSKLAILFPALLLLLLSVLVNRIYVLSDMFSRNTLWPGHAFLLLSVTVGLEASWLDIIIHGLGSILIVNELLNVHYNRDARLASFNIAFCIGIASFFESSVIFTAPFLLLGLRQLKPLNLREYIVYLVGLSCPYYFLWAYAFLTGDFTQWAGVFPVETWFSAPSGMEWFHWARWGLALLTVLVVLGSVFARFDALGVQQRRLMVAVAYLILGSGATLLAGGGNPVVILYMAAGFAYPATLLMLRLSNKPYLELMHIIFVGIILAARLAGNI